MTEGSMMISCPTEGCVNHGVELEVTYPLDDDTGEPDANWQGVWCAGCQQWIHLTPAHPDHPESVHPNVLGQPQV